jgi:trans-aconitate methyltransferase
VTGSGDILLALLDPRPEERILDAGCGIGALSGKIAASGARVVGIEVLGVLLEQARLANPGVEFIEGDLLRHRPAELYDAVFANALLHWFKKPDEPLSAIARVLKAGGRLAAAVGFVPETVRRLETYHPPDARQYEKALQKAGFTLVTMQTAHDGFAFLARRNH